MTTKTLICPECNKKFEVPADLFVGRRRRYSSICDKCFDKYVKEYEKLGKWKDENKRT